MPRLVMNEGRVVGLSAYEIYVKHFLKDNPDKEPASEIEWLSSTLALGSSMLMKVTKEDQADDADKVIDIQLPADSKLCASSTIIASYFNGSGEVSDGANFATKVTDYGPLINNYAGSSPAGTIGRTGTIPSRASGYWTTEEKEKLEGYLAILDGIVIQPGTWTDNPNKPPQKDFVPDLSVSPRVRLHIRGPIKRAFFILLTGFTMRSVIQGESITDESAVNTPSPEDGDFLGHSCFPWASKIIFSMPSAAVSYFLLNTYTRKLPDTSAALTVSGSSVIDMRKDNLFTYYQSEHTDAPVNIKVTDFSPKGDGASVLTVYQKSTSYPPALYGTKVTSVGDNKIYPLAVVAPGSVHMFNSGAEEATLKDYESKYPGTFAIKRNGDGTVATLNKDDKLVSIASTSTSEVADVSTGSDTTSAYVTINKAGNATTKSLSLVKSDGKYLNMSGDGSVLSPTTAGKFAWKDLLKALKNNQTIDMYSKGLRNFQSALNDAGTTLNSAFTVTGDLNSNKSISATTSITAGGSITGGSVKAGGSITGGSVEATGSITGGSVKATGSVKAGTSVTASKGTVTAGTKYMVFGGLRLYIATEAPDDADIPNGSIGIGW